MNEAELQGLADGRAVRFVLPRRALHGATGSRLGPRAGESLEFHDYRDYAPGDDLRNLDWNVLARTDREVVKVRREEIAPVIEFVADRSASMETPPAKRETADYLFGLFTAAAPTSRVVARETPRTVRSVRVFVSDLLLAESPDAVLARLSRQAASVIVIRTLAREEADPPASGSFELVDSETDERREVTLDGPTRAAYLDALARHTALWTAAARRFGATFVDLIAEDPPRGRILRLAAAGVMEGL